MAYRVIAKRNWKLHWDYKILSPLGSLVSLDCKIILTGSSASVPPCDMIKQSYDQINSWSPWSFWCRWARVLLPLASPDSILKVSIVARLNVLGGSPNQIFESNKWLLINRYRQECMRIAREFYDESIFNTSHGTQRHHHMKEEGQQTVRQENSYPTIATLL